MDDSKSNDSPRVVPAEATAGLPRRQFLGDVVKVAGGLLLGDLAAATAVNAQPTSPPAPAVGGQTFTDWGWPLPYEQISAKSKQWLQSKGWWPISAAWIVVWASQEMIGHVLQTQKLLEKRGIETDWKTFVAAGFSNEAFIPGRIQIASTGALGVLALLSNKVPMRAVAVHSPGLTHAATVPLDSPLNSLADLKGAKVLKRPAVVGTTTGSTNHFGFIAAAHYLDLKPNEDYTLRSTPPGDLATGPKGIDVYTIWEPHVSYSTEVLKVTRLLETLDPYYIYSGYYYGRQEIEDNAPDVMQLITDAFMEAVLWAKANPDDAVKSLMSRPEYGPYRQNDRALSVLAKTNGLLSLRRSERNLAERGSADQRLGLRDGRVEEQGHQPRLAEGAPHQLHGCHVRQAGLESAGAAFFPAQGLRRGRQSALQAVRGSAPEGPGAVPRTGRAQKGMDVQG